MQEPIRWRHQPVFRDKNLFEYPRAWRQQKAGETIFACESRSLASLGRFLRRGYLVEGGVGNFVGFDPRCSFNQL